MKDAGCYQLGHGIGYTKGADKRIGWQRLRRRMRKDALGWLKAILSGPFKASNQFPDLRPRNQEIRVYVHVNESVHTVNEPV